MQIRIRDLFEPRSGIRNGKNSCPGEPGKTSRIRKTERQGMFSLSGLVTIDTVHEQRVMDLIDRGSQSTRANFFFLSFFGG